MLEISNLNKSFWQGQNKIDVLKDLNLSVSKGEKVAILGQSGSGKSTLLSLLAGIDRPESGNMSFEGRELGHLNEAELTELRSKRIGIIFQQFHLLPHLNAHENVSLPLEIQGQLSKSDIQERVSQALQNVGLGHRMDHFPSQLSGGEKQRVAIARSMVIEPDLLLADEPSGSLDEGTGDSVMDLIFSLVDKQNKALILVTHNVGLAEKCEKIYNLEHGSLHLKERS